MRLSRRSFVKLSGAGTAAVAAGLLLDSPSSSKAAAQEWPLPRRIGEASTICAYCAVGCGALVVSEGNNIVGVEGDPDHPINRGALCSKGMSLMQWAYNNNARRLTEVLYRAPNSSAWEVRSWDWALDRIAQNIKTARDASFVEAQDGVTVNRCESIAALGGATLNNEEDYLYVKLARALGIVYLEHQARICHSSTVAGLGATFGRGAMTNHWIDIKNADVILIMGSNAAENHPISFRWVTEAMERGATLISVDPRFTRTSALAHIYASLRPGTDRSSP